MTNDTRERARQVANKLVSLAVDTDATDAQWKDAVACALVAFANAAANAENEACERLARKRAEQFYVDQWPLIGDEHVRTADAIAARRKERK